MKTKIFTSLYLLLALTVSACGFESVYARKDIPNAMSGASIDIANVPDRDGQYLRNLLIDRLQSSGSPADAVYHLIFLPLNKNIVNIGIQKDATATRGQMQITTHMQLIEKSTGIVLLERDLKTVGAYNLLDNQLATIVSQQNITENMLQEMSDDVVTELNLHFRRQKI